MQSPLLLVNFKTYPSATGKNALELARIHQKLHEKTGVNIALAVQAIDLRLIRHEVMLPVFAQHFDAVGQGAFTGHVSPMSLKEAGVNGSLLNHAERKISIDTLESAVNLARQHDLMTVVCAESTFTAKAVADLNPDFIAVEPPELIGGDVSVTSADPQLIRDAVAMVGQSHLLVGAGIKTAQDVQLALKLGASGVLVSSVITKAQNPEQALEVLLQGFLG